MNRSLALLFALLCVGLLCGVSLSIAYRSVWGAILCTVAAIGCMGYGFALSARMRRKRGG
ncbi:DUF5325 family protein [Paenibacillus sp. HJGM_3]|uniref:DUF5325 family protein n=1 Tax=Paenibacillus sp. HJGM_3 TaxID=3379816 RepID=UPI00385DAF2E